MRAKFLPACLMQMPNISKINHGPGGWEGFFLYVMMLLLLQEHGEAQAPPAPHFAGDSNDQGYGRGGTPIFTDVFEPLARVALYPTNEDGLGLLGAA